MEQKKNFEIGAQVYLEEGSDPCGAVRDVRLGNRNEITIYVENSGEFIVSLEAVRAAHDGKVILGPNTIGSEAARCSSSRP